MVRQAFTLIELVFAIVVMSVVMLSFPIIMQVDSAAREQSFAQEAVLAASAKMAQLFTFQWDERSLSWDDLAENVQSAARVLDGTGNTVAFQRVAGTELRPSAGHRHFFPTEQNATGIKPVDDNTSVTALDDQTLDFNTSSGFDAGFLADSFGYKRNYQMQVRIARVNDGSAINYNQTVINGFVFTQGDINAQSNLRCMEVSIRDGDTNTTIARLYGYAANIGEYSAYSRIRP